MGAFRSYGNADFRLVTGNKLIKENQSAQAVCFVSPHEKKGGASRIANYLHKAMLASGVRSYQVVGVKTTNEQEVYSLPEHSSKVDVFYEKAMKRVNREFGIEHFDYPASRRLLDILPERPDLIHFHNIQGKYFDLRYLPELSQEIPVLLTLHDTWMLTGHCSYFIECDRWLTGCGKCPDLERTPTLKRDGTRYNWKRKAAIYKKSKLYVASPSKWLLDNAYRSMLGEHIIRGRVINNGVDTTVFKPGNKRDAQRAFGVDEDSFVLMFAASSGLSRNAYKDFETIEKALHILSERTLPKKVTFIGLGQQKENRVTGSISHVYFPYQSDMREIARLYQAADLYLHAARADNFPNVILEAMACGTPVLATAIGGIPEQITDMHNGWLVPAMDPEAMADRIQFLIGNPDRIEAASALCSEEIPRKYSIARMVKDYQEYYQEIINDFRSSK